MDPELQPPTPDPASEFRSADEQVWPEMATSSPEDKEYHGLRWFFIGNRGLRAGWSVLLFVLLTAVFVIGMSSAASVLLKQVMHRKAGTLTPLSALIGELMSVVAILCAGVIVAKIERRQILDYNLRGPKRALHFVGGVAAGFAALSALLGTMSLGGWVHFGPVALSGAQILGYAALWGAAFLLTGFFEEGSFRCFLQYTITRGINFWWALGIVGVFCIDLVVRSKGSGAWGVYSFALLGLVPCWLLHRAKAEGAGFWQAAWVTSTAFGFVHTGNNGENWIGIFSAAAIGFVFCVSVWVTGSAWWAIGCHAAWDWAETYFYGTADSGFVARGHFLTTSATGSVLWSGGTDGPEGSLLILPVILLLLAALLLLYGRRKPGALTEVAAEPAP